MNINDILTEVHNNELVENNKLDFNLYRANGEIFYKKGKKLEPGLMLMLNYTKVFKIDRTRFSKTIIDKLESFNRLPVETLSEKFVRRLCDNCKEKYKLSLEEIEELFIHNRETEVFFYKPTGCASCNNTGFSGQIPIHEFLGFQTFKYDGIKKCLLGFTSISEL